MSSVDRPRLAPLALAFALGVLGAASLAGCNGSSPPSGSPTSPSPQPLPVPRVLRVAKTGSGTGTVTSTDLTIDCGERCQATFLATTSVTLQALPDAGSGFVRWEGDPDCADGVVSTMADVSCTAVFETPRVVTVSTIGGGSGSVKSPDSAISCPPVCQDTLFGTVPVTLVAVPSVGSLFAGFAGDPDCADGMLSTTADIACTARFEPVSTLGVTGFLAFGDSFTLGIVSLPSLNGFRLTGTPESYPSQLLGLLGASYPNQTFMMDNRGVSGERAEDGVLRLPMVLAEVGASVGAMLLIHGVNDLEAFRMAGIPKIAADVDSMVQQAQAMGLPVFLGNLPPQRPTVNKGRREVAPLVPLLNAEYARIAATRGVTLVDLFRGVDLALIGRDGLHPTAAGYVRIAELFFAAIAAAFDMPTVITGGDTGTGSGGAGGGTGSGGSGGTGSGGTGSGGGGGGTGSGSGGTTIAPPAGSPAPAPWQMRWKRRLGQPR